jgi:hypothetical protein
MRSKYLQFAPADTSSMLNPSALLIHGLSPVAVRSSHVGMTKLTSIRTYSSTIRLGGEIVKAIQL